MTRRSIIVAGAGMTGLLAGGLLWAKWGTLIWLDAAIAYCL